MMIDLPTLMVAGGFVAAVSGVFLVFAWLQNREAVGTLWWAASNLVLAGSVSMMAGILTTDAPSNLVAITLLNVSPALIWASARACNNHRVNFAIVLSGAFLWLLAATTMLRMDSQGLIALNLAIIAAFMIAAAYEFWRDRHQRLDARWPLIVLLALHGAVSAIGSLEAMTGALGGVAGSGLVEGWLRLVHFETLAFVVGTSIFTVAMAREKGEMLQRIAASTDALTGVATRRAFYEVGEAIVGAGHATRAALAVIVFDLDGFKSINDTFGHSRGDDVLRAFGRIAAKTLRTTDLIGRLGGEEFAAVLPGASIATAFIAAERIRAGLGEACKTINASLVNATVSAGIAQLRPDSTLDSLLTAADQALYEAKRHGRNRVEISDSGPVAGKIGGVIASRVA